MRQERALVALGANLPSKAGAPGATLQAALIALQGVAGIQLTAISRFYATPAFPPGSGPDYVNACAALQTTLAPSALLARLHEVEARFGRQRNGDRWAARGIDLDLLAMGDSILPDSETHRQWCDMSLTDQQSRWPDQLILPHPRLQDRAFVLLPLADIAGDWQHPVTDRRLSAMIAALPAADRSAIRPIASC